MHKVTRVRVTNAMADWGVCCYVLDLYEAVPVKWTTPTMRGQQRHKDFFFAATGTTAGHDRL